ncbi:hypothetical protein M8818_006398 [Zalaria obscura]|uniref:Uncharacterized protein n=1 Tax=Zalaria obscura TaxID=2024903 RepID=A0ACC3S8S4_9PEZI
MISLSFRVVAKLRKVRRPLSTRTLSRSPALRNPLKGAAHLQLIHAVQYTYSQSPKQPSSVVEAICMQKDASELTRLCAAFSGAARFRNRAYISPFLREHGRPSQRPARKETLRWRFAQETAVVLSFSPFEIARLNPLQRSQSVPGSPKKMPGPRHARPQPPKLQYSEKAHRTQFIHAGCDVSI